MGEKSLTMQEAGARAALVAVLRYDIEVDLRGLLEGETLRSVSTITFTCHEPGATTFVDCLAEVSQATLNGVDLDSGCIVDGRITLSDLQVDNVLVIASSQADTASGAGVLRSIDPSDQLVYVWTSFEPDEAHRLWACFDQPDLKAPHAFTVHAPETWTVLSNCGPDSVTSLDSVAGEGSGGGGRTWHFPDTPPLSTYVVVVNAGPFHEIRSERGDHDLGLYCRQSLRANFERDSDWLFEVTEQGLAFFADKFGVAFPQRRYDQVFVPNMGGAMENWGCVTWGDTMMSRTPPTYNELVYTSNVLLHEMAHQWFGDLVTMRWWDDLWLNEAFASWAADWALAATTRFTDAWAVFLAQSKILGYRDDMGPSTHAIRAQVPDVASASANFDAITYVKGQSVLKQLAAFVGEDAFVEGLRAYFNDHAYGNTTLDDLMEAFAAAAGRDLSGWTRDWLDRAGTDTLTLTASTIEALSPDGGPPRPHRLDIGCYDETTDGLALVETVAVETAGASTPVSLPSADLYLLNDDDLTFAAVRTEAANTRALLDGAAHLPTPLGRALVLTTAWDMLVKGEMSSGDYLDCLLTALARESAPSLVEPFLTQASRTVTRWTRDDLVVERSQRVADVAASLAGDHQHRQPALRTLASTATDATHFDLLAQAARDDVDLEWRILARRAALGEHDQEAVEALLDRDPDPDAAIRALGVRAARPTAQAKEEVWHELFVARSVPAGREVFEIGVLFWQPAQTELLLPFAHRYLDEAASLSGGGMLDLMSLLRAMAPNVADDELLARGAATAQSPDVLPVVRATILTVWDSLARMHHAKRA